MDTCEQNQTVSLDKRSLIGVVLAGGMSRRMGRDKALLPFQGGTLLQHQVDILQPLCAQVLVSGNYSGFDCVSDNIERCGPLGGIYSLANQYPDSALLFIAVDTPQVTESHLRALMACQQASFYHGHPLPAFFPHSKPVLAAIEAILASQDPNFSIKHLHQALNSMALPADECIGLNLNNPIQWQEFIEQANSNESNTSS